VGNEVRIHVIPKEGVWSIDDVRVGTTGFRYDLVIVVGAQSLSDIGPVTERYADFFYDTPLMVVDPTPLQGVFGQFHVSDPLATSTSEVVARFLAEVSDSSLTEQVATTLLTGMIARTKSFKVDGVTPRTLDMAGVLLNHGAKREVIVEKLYRTRSVETLRLWGHALTNLQAEPKIGLAWTTLTRRDFVGAKAGEAAVADVVSELVATAPDARVIVLLHEMAAGGVGVRLFAEHPHDALLLGAPFSPTGTRSHAVLSVKGSDLLTAEQEVLTHLRSVLRSTTRHA
jgi:phosphoesterase RecJ-like protein